MTKDETKDEALKADDSVVEEESPASEPEEVSEDTAEETPVEPEGGEEEESSTEEEESEGTQEGESRKTAKSRIRELVAEKKHAEQVAKDKDEKAESLADQVAKMTEALKPRSPLPSQDAASSDGEISYEDLMRRQDALVQIRMAQQEALNRINNESQEVMKAYPELDPDSESFDTELSESISQATLASIQSNPGASVKKFVDGLMKPYRRSLEKQEAGQREAITKQASKQAVRPSSVQEQEKPFSELSIEEMEKKLGIAHR